MRKIEYLPNKHYILKNGENEISILNNLFIRENDVTFVNIVSDNNEVVDRLIYKGQLSSSMPTTPVCIIVEGDTITLKQTQHEQTDAEIQKNKDAVENAINKKKHTIDEINDIISYDKDEIIQTVNTVIKIAEKEDIEVFKKYKESISPSKNKILKFLKGETEPVNLPLRLRLTIDTMLEYPKETSSIINNYNYTNGEKYLLIENVLAVKTIVNKLRIYSSFIVNTSDKVEFLNLLETVEEYSGLLNHNLDKLFESSDVKIELIAYYELFKYLDANNVADINLIIKGSKYKEEVELLRKEIDNYLIKTGGK